jgi:hypothetical protein
VIGERENERERERYRESSCIEEEKKRIDQYGGRPPASVLQTNQTTKFISQQRQTDTTHSVKTRKFSP